MTPKRGKVIGQEAKMNKLELLAEKLRKEHQEREERVKSDYRARFWSKANDKPDAP